MQQILAAPCFGCCTKPSLCVCDLCLVCLQGDNEGDWGTFNGNDISWNFPDNNEHKDTIDIDAKPMVCFLCSSNLPLPLRHLLALGIFSPFLKFQPLKGSCFSFYIQYLVACNVVIYVFLWRFYFTCLQYFKLHSTDFNCLNHIQLQYILTLTFWTLKLFNILF